MPLLFLEGGLSMDFLRVLVFETVRVAIGLYGLCFIYATANITIKGIERLVKQIGIQKGKYLGTKTRRI